MLEVTIASLSPRARCLLAIPQDADVSHLDPVTTAQRLDAAEYQESRPPLSRIERALRAIGLRKDPIKPFSPEVQAARDGTDARPIKSENFEAATHAALDVGTELKFTRNDGVCMTLRPGRANGPHL